jgi:4-amino-4-deoxy-L-arabinose transferase-like glycosyltransferase/putative flippase GtrA
VQLLLLELLTRQGLPPFAANALAMLVSAQVNFWLSQTFTWRDREAADLGSLAVRWLRFHGAIAGTALLNLVVFSVAALVLPHLAAAALGIGTAAVGNFILGDRLVFRARPAAHIDGDTALASGSRSAGRARLLAGLGLAMIVGVALLLDGWGLSRNGYANQYYAAAVLSMSQSWHSFFYGALDAGGFITVDKPPFAFWVQSLSVRLFGMSSWSILLPQTAAALATILAVYWMARRQFGAPAATLAGLMLALTPITVAVARVNLPDTILVLLLTLGAWATFTAIRSGRLGPLLLGMALVGLGFNTKMMQAFVVVPAFVGAYLMAAPGSLWRRLAHLTLAGMVLLGVSASWLTVVDSVPPDQRPYVGGSSDNSVLDLAVGYNGLGRVFGQGLARGASPMDVIARVASALLPSTDSDLSDDASAGAAAASGGAPVTANGGAGDGFSPGRPWNGGGPGFGGPVGWLRLFNTQVGGQIGWLLPLAGLSVAAGLLAGWRRPRADATRGWYLLWGGWLVTHVVVFSFAEGIFHPYYTSALAPSVAALAGPGIVAFWRAFRRSWWLAWALPASLAGTAAVSLVLATRSEWLPWLAPTIVAATGIGVVGLLIGRLIRRPMGRRIALAGLMVGLAGILAGPAAWASTPMMSDGLAVNPQAGPMDSFGFGRGGFGRGGFGGPGRAATGSLAGPGTVGAVPPSQDGGPDTPGAQAPAGGPSFAPPVPGLPVVGQPALGIGRGAFRPGGPFTQGGPFGQGGGRGAGRAGRGFGPATTAAVPSSGPESDAATGAGQGEDAEQIGPGGGGRGGPFGGGAFGPPGRIDSGLVQYLEANRGSAEYLVAVNSSMAAAPLILETDVPVMAMGGFSGGDPAPTAEQLAEYVVDGKLRFVMLGGRGGGPGRGPGGNSVAGERTAWVEASCQAVDPAAYGAPDESDAPGGRGGQQLYDCAPGLATTSAQPGS